MSELNTDNPFPTKSVDEILRDNEILTQEHKTKILECWNSRKDNPPSILELVQLCYGEKYDGRSFYARLIKEFLASCKMKTKTTANKPTVTPTIIPLTEEQKQFITDNCEKMKSLEITRQLFNNPILTALSQEFKQVYSFLQSLPPETKRLEDQKSKEEEDGKYKAPKTLLQAARRVNKYVLDCIDEQTIEKSSKVQKFLKGVVKFTHMYRFINTWNSFAREKDKEMFEASYIRFVYDKPDLQEMELDLLCNLCCDIVNYTNMQGELEDLKKMRDDCLEDSEGKRMSMSLVEEMKNIRKEMDDNHKRQVATAKMLEGSRNERMDLRSKESATLLHVIDFWRHQEYRKQMIALAEIRKKNIKDEVERIKNMDDLKIQIFGISDTELIN